MTDERINNPMSYKQIDNGRELIIRNINLALAMFYDKSDDLAVDLIIKTAEVLKTEWRKHELQANR